MSSISSDQWAQFYHDGAVAESTAVSHLASNANSKPNCTPRRRTRASRKAPTTLLNASTANFRDLVQQFTGFHAAGASMPLGTHKGPVNLSFGQAGEHELQNHASVMVPFSDGRHFQYRPPQVEQQFAFPSENSRSSDADGGNNGFSRPTSEFLEIQNLMDEDMNYDHLQELALEFSSNGNGNGNYGGSYFPA